MGKDKSIDIFKETREIESIGGMMTLVNIIYMLFKSNSLIIYRIKQEGEHLGASSFI